MRQLLIAGLLMIVCVGRATRIVVAPAATARGAQVWLSDVATVDGTADEVQQLNKVLLGTAPPLGQSYTFSLSMIRMRLRQYGIDYKSLTIDCSAPVIVTRIGNHLSGQAIVDAAQQWLQAHLPPPEQTTAFVPTRLPADMDLAAGVLSWTCAELPTSTALRREVQITALVDGTSAWHGQVTLAAHQLTPVLVVKSTIQPGQLVTADLVSVEQRDLTQVFGTPVDSLQNLLGLRTASLLAPGKIILTTDVQAVPVVKRGEFIPVRAHCGALIITVMAIAESDGTTGAIVRMKNADTREEFTARLLSRDEIEIVQ